MTRSNVNKKISFYLNQSEKVQRNIELFEQDSFDYWASITWVTFMFTYCNNKFNKKNNRVGKISGFRIGTTNPDLIPSADRASGRGKGNAKRYYDVTRAGTTVLNGISSGGLRGKVTSNLAQAGQWRAFRPDTFSVMVSIWSFEKEKFVSKPEDFIDKNAQNSG